MLLKDDENINFIQKLDLLSNWNKNFPLIVKNKYFD